MTEPKEIKEEVRIPAGVELTIQDRTVHVKGSKGSLSRKFSHPKVTLAKQDTSLIISCKQSPHRKEKALIGTYAAHVRNMIGGVTTGYEYKLKTVYSHFPIKNSTDGNTFIIQNFLGERSPRKAVVLDGVKVAIQGDFITVTGADIEKVGQTAANIERATRVKKRDVRVFQDGIYIISQEGGKP